MICNGACVCERITSWYPNFNGSHFDLPPSEIHRMTGLGGKFVWTMAYSIFAQAPSVTFPTSRENTAIAVLYRIPVLFKCQRKQNSKQAAHTYPSYFSHLPHLHHIHTQTGHYNITQFVPRHANQPLSSSLNSSHLPDAIYHTLIV